MSTADAAEDPINPAPLSSTESDIEEGRDSYKPGGFHPVYIGDVYNEKYKVLGKIGYGVYSSVWLVEHLEP
jgi:serine/threonine-protein kinase SRPK3